jgi:hypothetical protein
LETSVTNQIFIPDEVKIRLSSGDVCSSFYGLMPSCQVCKNLEIKIYNIFNIACCFVRVQKLISHAKGRIYKEQGDDKIIFTQDDERSGIGDITA